MAATPTDIAHYTTDGVRLTSPTNPATSTALRTAHPNAQDQGTSEIEQFFVDPADGQAELDITYSLLSRVNPPYLAVEIDDTLGLGSTIALTPIVPTGRVFDKKDGYDENLLVRGYAQQMGNDRYAVELIKGP